MSAAGVVLNGQLEQCGCLLVRARIGKGRGIERANFRRSPIVRQRGEEVDGILVPTEEMERQSKVELDFVRVPGSLMCQPECLERIPIEQLLEEQTAQPKRNIGGWESPRKDLTRPFKSGCLLARSEFGTD